MGIAYFVVIDKIQTELYQIIQNSSLDYGYTFGNIQLSNFKTTIRNIESELSLKLFNNSDINGENIICTTLDALNLTSHLKRLGNTRVIMRNDVVNNLEKVISENNEFKMNTLLEKIFEIGIEKFQVIKVYFENSVITKIERQVDDMSVSSILKDCDYIMVDKTGSKNINLNNYLPVSDKELANYIDDKQRAVRLFTRNIFKDGDFEELYTIFSNKQHLSPQHLLNMEIEVDGIREDVGGSLLTYFMDKDNKVEIESEDINSGCTYTLYRLNQTFISDIKTFYLKKYKNTTPKVTLLVMPKKDKVITVLTNRTFSKMYYFECLNKEFDEFFEFLKLIYL